MGKDPFLTPLGKTGLNFGPTPSTGAAVSGIAQGFGQTFFPAHQRKQEILLKKAENLPARWDAYKSALKAEGLEAYAPQKPAKDSYKTFRANFLSKKGISLDDRKVKSPRELREVAKTIDVLSNLNKIAPTGVAIDNKNLADQIAAWRKAPETTPKSNELGKSGITTKTAQASIEELARTGQLMIAGRPVAKTLDEAIAYYQTTPYDETVNSLVAYKRFLTNPEKAKTAAAEDVRRSAILSSRSDLAKGGRAGRLENRAQKAFVREEVKGQKGIEKVAAQREQQEADVLRAYDIYEKGFAKSYKKFWTDVLHQTPDMKTIMAIHPQGPFGPVAPGTEISAEKWMKNFDLKHKNILTAVDKTITETIEGTENLSKEEELERKSNRDLYVNQLQTLVSGMTGDLDRVGRTPEGMKYRTSLSNLWQEFTNVGGAYFIANQELYKALDQYDLGNDKSAETIKERAVDQLEKMVPSTLILNGEKKKVVDLLSQPNGYQVFKDVYTKNLQGRFDAWNKYIGNRLDENERNEWVNTQVNLLDNALTSAHRYEVFTSDSRLSGMTRKKKREKLMEAAYAGDNISKAELLGDIIGAEVQQQFDFTNPPLAQSGNYEDFYGK